MQDIEKSLLASIVEGRIAPGTRLSESQLAQVFDVSRTLVREALQRLEARHIIRVMPRRGWFVNAPSAEEAAHIYAARKTIEAGFLRQMDPLDAGKIAILDAHLAKERDAIGMGDRSGLTYLMGDFHTRIVELSGNPVLVEIMRNLTARTMLISMRFQSSTHALQSHEGHCRIMEALRRHDHDEAARCAVTHLDEVQAGLILDLRDMSDPVVQLRETLSPGTDRRSSSSSTSKITETL